MTTVHIPQLRCGVWAPISMCPSGGATRCTSVRSRTRRPLVCQLAGATQLASMVVLHSDSTAGLLQLEEAWDAAVHTLATWLDRLQAGRVCRCVRARIAAAVAGAQMRRGSSAASNVPDTRNGLSRWSTMGV